LDNFKQWKEDRFDECRHKDVIPPSEVLASLIYLIDNEVDFDEAF